MKILNKLNALTRMARDNLIIIYYYGCFAHVHQII